MRNTILALVCLLMSAFGGKSQTAMDFNTSDCDGNMHHLFDYLDSGQVVILHFYMPNCGSCPPPAQKIQAMASPILAAHPGMIKAFAFPYQNTTTCTYSQSWVSNNHLQMYHPMDSGALMVAYYGGFGMPTVVLLGGTDHRVLFSTLSFQTSDTTIMKDSILAILEQPVSAIGEQVSVLSGLKIQPNPSNDHFSLELTLKQPSELLAEILDVQGNRVALIMNEKVTGSISREVITSSIPSGNYILRIQTSAGVETRKLNVIH